MPCGCTRRNPMMRETPRPRMRERRPRGTEPVILVGSPGTKCRPFLTVHKDDEKFAACNALADEIGPLNDPEKVFRLLEEAIGEVVPASTETPDYPEALLALRKAAEHAQAILRGASMDAADEMALALWGPDKVPPEDDEEEGFTSTPERGLLIGTSRMALRLKRADDEVKKTRACVVVIDGHVQRLTALLRRAHDNMFDSDAREAVAAQLWQPGGTPGAALTHPEPPTPCLWST